MNFHGREANKACAADMQVPTPENADADEELTAEDDAAEDGGEGKVEDRRDEEEGALD